MSKSICRQHLSNMELAIMIVFSAYAIMPDFSLMPEIVHFGLMLIYLAFVATRNSSYEYPNNVGKFIFIALYLTVLYYILTDTQTVRQNVSNRDLKVLFSKFNQFSYQVMPFAIMYRLVSKGTPKQRRIVLVFTTIFFGITLVTTNAFLNAYPGAIRSFHNTNFNEAELRGLGNS